ncbi:hypothetical protein M409DRAFT_30642 [Zasmidium cellare ATCC 36951]|uniref:SnoaL-like domain-containing protein n=1 Tax=Zasmidium cellare ATCC 36951 TaxID=1080233 RepID=A0A6A6BZJ3_ZASCE|nr:uncharacterized protein M409DRAFT_30642 [Zasmidium cellare ATCC 36951]KAF2158856.1 hypothetical protein M409DRAFT_30642 [Zasmidium cellare ATCC 36951]
MSQDLYAALRRTVDAVVAAYSSPEPWNPDQIWATRTDDCLHYIHPVEAIPQDFRVAIDKDHHIQSLKFLGPVLESFELDLKDAVIDVRTRTTVIRLTAKYDLLAVGNEGPDHGLTTDFMWLMEMDEEGKRIKRVEEFLDQSSFLAVVIERATKYAESKQ